MNPIPSNHTRYYVVATFEPVPEDYTSYIDKLDVFSALRAVQKSSTKGAVDFEIKDTAIATASGFTGTQLATLQLASTGELSRYINILNILQSGNIPVYLVTTTDHYLMMHPVLECFVERSQIL